MRNLQEAVMVSSCLGIKGIGQVFPSVVRCPAMSLLLFVPFFIYSAVRGFSWGVVEVPNRCVNYWGVFFSRLVFGEVNVIWTKERNVGGFPTKDVTHKASVNPILRQV